MVNYSFFQIKIRFRLGNGKRIKFCEDIWCMEEYECVSRRKSQLISQIVKVNYHGTNWDLNLCRRLTDEEVEQCAGLATLLDFVKPLEEEDGMLWVDSSTDFMPKKATDRLWELRRQEGQLGVQGFPFLKYGMRTWCSQKFPFSVGL